MPITVIDKSFSRGMGSPSESTVSIFVDWPARLKKVRDRPLLKLQVYILNPGSFTFAGVYSTASIILEPGRGTNVIRMGMS